MPDDSFASDEDATGLASDIDIANEMAETLKSSSATFARTLVNGMKSAILEGKRLDSVLKSAARSISAQAFRAGLQPLVSLITQGTSGIVGKAVGGVSGGLVSAAKNLLPFADGGVIGAPTTFPLPDGRTGLMGEAGREAILPLARGPDGRLGVGIEGGAARTAPIVVNITTPDVDSFERSEAQVTAMLARAVGRGRRGL